MLLIAQFVLTRMRLGDLRGLAVLSVALFPDAPVGMTVPSVAAQSDEGRKIALIIAISEYGTPVHPRTGESLRPYRPLNAKNDVPLIRGVLEVQGFRSEDIRVLQDADADAEGIREAFRWLVREARAGDVVVLHYSGHGHRMSNDNPAQDEEVDGYDEVLVPYGAPDEFYEGYDGGVHIRDDEVGEVLAELRRRVGPRGNVTFFLDACYSGTATRGQDDLAARGSLGALGPPNPADAEGDSDGTGIEMGDAPGTRGGDEGLAPYAVFSAASQRQVAYETFDVDGTTRVGSLSYALARTLPQASPGTTYRALFADITRTLAGKVRQTPQMEGVVDAQLFSNRLTQQSPYVVVDTVTEDGTLVTLAGGTLLGLNPGTRLLVHESGVARPDSASALATLVVRQADPLEVVAEVTDGSLDPTHVGSWAFVTSRTFGDLATRVHLSPELRERDREGLLRVLGGLGIVQLTGEGPDVVVEPVDGVVVARTVQDGLVLARGAVDVVRVVEDYARNQYLRRLDFEARGIAVTFELAPVGVERDLLGRVRGCQPPDWGDAPDSPAHLGANQWRMAPGDTYSLRVMNTGSRRAFLALLDLLPLGGIKVLRPREGEAPSSYEMEPGAILELGCYQLGEDIGHETLKLFATASPQDFRAMFETRGTRGSGGSDLSALEEVLAASYTNTRSGEVGAPRGTATTEAIQIHVTQGR